MIYNLVNYLKAQLGSLTFVADGWNKDSAEEALTVIQNGGEDKPWFNRQTYNIQVMSRSSSKTVARKNIQSVYNLLRKRFGLVFPQVTVDGELFPAVTAWQISPNQIPGYIGSDDRNLEMWSVNFRIITT